MLFLSSSSGSPGGDVLLTGLAFPPQATVLIKFTHPAVGGPKVVELGTVQASLQGTFQVLATVPMDPYSGLSHFVAEAGATSATAPFAVGAPLRLVLTPPAVWAGTDVDYQAWDFNPNGYLVLQSDFREDATGPYPLANKQNPFRYSYWVPFQTIGGTHQMTSTVRINGISVQRAVADLQVWAPSPTPTRHPWTEAYVGTPGHAEGIRGETATVKGVSFDPQCGGSFGWLHGTVGGEPTCTYSCWTPSGFDPVCETQCDQPFGPGPASCNYSTGDFWGTLPIPANYTNLTKQLPWGEHRACLFRVSPAISWAYDPEYTTLQCAPFLVREPEKYRSGVELYSLGTGQLIGPEYGPQITVIGQAVGFYTGTHPLPVHQTFAQIGANIPLVLPEGNYKMDIAACHFRPILGQPLPGDGRSGNHPVQRFDMEYVDKSGPIPQSVTANFNPLAGVSDKLGPYMSFRGVDEALRPPNQWVDFAVDFAPIWEIIDSVKATVVTAEGTNVVQAAMINGDKLHWKLSLDVSDLPPGPVSLSIVAHGRGPANSVCNVLDDGPSWDRQLAIVPAPPWFGKPWAISEPVTVDGGGAYHFKARLGHGVPGYDLPNEGSIDLGYLGELDNLIDGEFTIIETFKPATAQWWASASGKAKGQILNYPDPPLTASLNLVAQPGSGKSCQEDPVACLANPYPESYKKEMGPLAISGQTDFGPYQVYDGVIASFWGIVNVRLSVSFGVHLFMSGGGLADAALNPNITIAPGGQLTGNIALWIDILLGIAEAGIEGIPQLGYARPLTIDQNGASVSSAACFRLYGRIWASFLFWEAEWGPEKLGEWGQCSVFPLARAADASDPPPSTLSAPAITTDGYMHVLATWVHNDSNTPGQNLGALYYAYWDGGQWLGPAVAASSGSRLLSGPAVAFAGQNEAVAVLASNVPNNNKPDTADKFKAQMATQQIATLRFDGTAWTGPALLTYGGGARGRAVLAGDPVYGRAMAMWVHDAGAGGSHKWEVEYSVYTAATHMWSTPAVVSPNQPASSLDAEITLAFDRWGRVMASWVRQENANFADNAHRSLVVARWNAVSDKWAIETPAELPKGALMPTLAFDESTPVLAYVTYSLNKAGGLGNATGLSIATYTGSNWLTQPVQVAGQAERPQLVAMGNHQMLLTYRQYGADAGEDYFGTLAGAILDLTNPGHPYVTKPGKLTTGGPAWMYSTTVLQQQAVNPGGVVSSSAMPAGSLQSIAASPQTGGVLQPSLVVAGLFNLRPASQQAQATLAGSTLRPLSLSDDIIALQVPIAADLAVSDMAAGDTWPEPRTGVPLTVTVSNLGLGKSDEATLTLIMDPGTPEEETLAVASVPAALRFNETHVVHAKWQARAGVHRLTAQVRTTLENDISGENNSGQLLLGVPETPVGLIAAPAAGGGVGLTWQAVENAQVTGYMVYRAGGSDEAKPFALAGEPFAQDEPPAGAYRYSVATVGQGGIQSPRSAEVTYQIGEPPAVYLPLVQK